MIERSEAEALVLETIEMHQRMISGVGRCGCGLPVRDEFTHREHMAVVLGDVVMQLLEEVQ